MRPYFADTLLITTTAPMALDVRKPEKTEKR